MSNKSQDSGEKGGSPGKGCGLPDYAAWEGAIKRVGPGLLRYFRGRPFPSHPHDISDGLMDAINDISSKHPWFNPRDKEMDRYLFVAAKNKTMNNLRKSWRERPLTFQPQVYDPEIADTEGGGAELNHLGSMRQPDIMEDLKTVLLALSEDKRKFILNYVQLLDVKTDGERQKALRIRKEIEQKLRAMGHNSFGAKQAEGGEL
jgi:DNA-directed RNA polymerase specialized sigma24 family protein